MAHFRGGAYTMATSRHSVRVKPFCLDVTEVTVAAYGRCVAAGTCRPAYDTVDWPSIDAEDRTKYSQFCNRDREDRRDHPVNCVTWDQARAYCGFASGRLPSEEEWEWAARGAERGTPYPWGDAPPSDRLCWGGEGNDAGQGKRRGTCAVGSYSRGDSPQGVKDLAGNVWEWTSSCENASCQRRVYRGGGWFNDDAEFILATSRYRGEPSNRIYGVGFRCARGAQ